MNISISEIDQNRFGMAVAKVNIDSRDAIPDILAWCVERNVKLLIARCDTNDICKVQEMERVGFSLMDTLVYYRNKNIRDFNLPLGDEYQCNEATVNDAERVENIARHAFKNFYGHYHTDRRLNRSAVDQVYTSWAKSSCMDNSIAEVVYVISHGNKAVGFITIKRIFDGAEIVLNAVLPEYQGRGLYGILVAIAKKWCHEKNIFELKVSTQINNFGPQKVWIRHGFEPFKNFYTFHKWF